MRIAARNYNSVKIYDICLPPLTRFLLLDHNGPHAVDEQVAEEEEEEEEGTALSFVCEGAAGVLQGDICCEVRKQTSAGVPAAST